MARLVHLYRDLWGLSRNPFPPSPIANAVDRSSPYYDGLHAGIARKMARAFLEPTNNVTLLWAVGEGLEARGYGKTRSLLWFADFINRDCGAKARDLCGRTI